MRDALTDACGSDELILKWRRRTVAVRCRQAPAEGPRKARPEVFPLHWSPARIAVQIDAGKRAEGDRSTLLWMDHSGRSYEQHPGDSRVFEWLKGSCAAFPDR